MPLPYDRIPSDLNALLVLTPDGTDKRALTARFYSDEVVTPFRVNLISTPIPRPGQPHGITEMNGRVLTITVSSAPSPNQQERMASWSATERLFVTYMHEIRHVVRTGRRRQILRPDWDVPSAPAASAEHLLAFEQELYSRFEYSIFHPTVSAPKVNWLSNYVTFLGSAPGIYNGLGQAYCEMIYGRVLHDINGLSDYFYYRKYPQISQATVNSVKVNYDRLLAKSATFPLVP